MDSLFILIPIALLFTALAMAAFFWAVDNKQYDDLDAAAKSILFDDDDLGSPEQSQQAPSNLVAKKSDESGHE
ncbi:MAG: cbb3-type cytochrome oxidase assembly protein CcoS [Pseudomonadales bacterium]